MMNTTVNLPVEEDGQIKLTNQWLEELAIDLNSWMEEFDHYEYYDCFDEGTVDRLKKSMYSKDDLALYIHKINDYLEELEDSPLRGKGVSILTRLEIAEGMTE